MDQNEKKVEEARRIARAKLDFIRHLTIYIIVMAVLVVINNVTSPGYQWWLWPAGGWGIGILAHFLSVFAFSSGRLEEKLIKKELEKMGEER